MKQVYYILVLFLVSILVSCVTGNDNNALLQELEDQFAMTPRVLNLMVDGVAPSRDEQSNWIPFNVSPGQQLSLTATFDSGNGASSATFDFSRTYYDVVLDEEFARAVEPFTERVMSLGSGTSAFNFTYTVPSVDDDGDAFGSGNYINLTWLSSNDLGGQGFNDINLMFE